MSILCYVPSETDDLIVLSGNFLFPFGMNGIDTPCAPLFVGMMERWEFYTFFLFVSTLKMLPQIPE